MVRLPSEGYKLIPGQRLAPFVPDGADPAQLEIVTDRLFTLFNRLAMYLLVAMALSTLGTIALLLVCCCCGGGKSGSGGERESSDAFSDGEDSALSPSRGENGGGSRQQNGGRVNGGGGSHGNGRHSSKRKTQ